MTKLSKCLWHLDIISFLYFGLCSFWDMIQGCCWCTVFGDSGGPVVEIILYRRCFLSWIDGNLRKLTVRSGPLASVSFDPSDVVFNKMMGVYLLIPRPLSPKGGPREDEKSAWENLGGSKAGQGVRLVISLYNKMLLQSRVKLPSRKCDL